MSKTDWPREALTPDAMHMLQEVLQDWCVEHGCALSSDEAQRKAKSLIDWFEFGVRNEADLKRLLRDEIAIEKASTIKS